MNTQTIYNIQTREQAAVSITGNHSGVAVYVMNELVDALGGIEPAFHEIKRLQNKNFMPRMGGEGKPLTMRDLELARENEKLGYRHWQWKTITHGHTFFYGYGYMDGRFFVFINSDGSVFERVSGEM